MTQPTPAPAVPPLPGDIGQPPTAPQPEPPAPPAPPASEPGESADELRAALAAERRQHRETRDALAASQRAGMTADQRRIEDAKAEGRAAALREAGTRVAAEAFRAAATGRLTDPAAIEAALEALDLSRFVGADGEVDREGIARLVEKIAPPSPAGPRIPAGAHPGASPDGGDFFRQALRRGT
jgi:hypothetical protein